MKFSNILKLLNIFIWLLLLPAITADYVHSHGWTFYALIPFLVVYVLVYNWLDKLLDKP